MEAYSMFSFFKKKQLSIPPFSDDVMEVERQTTRWCQAQIGDYLGTGPRPLPDFGLNQDVMVGSYVCGFMQGQFIVGGQLNRWAKNDKGMTSLGFSMLVGPCLESILGSIERSLATMAYLPQVGRAKETTAIQQMDNMGGWDGMPHAKGEPKQKNGLLRFYLENNIEQVRRAD
jgi:hypothetical protein